jgi:hypothetical protein
MDLETLLCLGKYLFERKNNDTLERDFENKYAAENKDIKKKTCPLKDLMGLYSSYPYPLIQGLTPKFYFF